MRIAVSGCSFTYGQKDANWPALLNGHVITNLSHPGAGNKYIADSIIYQTSISKYDLVLVMWSGLTRIDIPITDNTYLFHDYTFKQHINHAQYIMSGGIVGSWKDNSSTRQLFENSYKILSDEDLTLLSLLEIIKLQSVLKSRNIKYYFMSYINYWNQSTNWTSKNCDQSINNFKNLNSHVDQIDFEPWIFLNDNKDGIFELATELNSFFDDQFHPGDIAHKEWANKILAKINCD